MELNKLGKRAQEYVRGHWSDFLLAGVSVCLCGTCASIGWRRGSKAGHLDAAYYTHVGILGDTNKFLELGRLGIEKYTGTKLSELEKDAATFAAIPVEEFLKR